MPKDVIERFELEFLQIINEQGVFDSALLPPFKDPDFKKIFETMVLVRTFNQRALSLQREGRIGTYASILGQEASQIGSALALEDGDWIFPSFRESGVFISRGYPMWMLYRYWMGDERGMKAPEGMNIFPMSVPVGTHLPHATGAAFAMKHRGDKKVAAVYFGDGGSSRGDFHEALNLAGVFKAPVIFLLQNNQWAISVPRARQSAAKTLAQRAFGYGVPGIQVDGNDLMAVYSATKEAVDRARRGDGPTLIECYTYRLDDHTTSDDASRYRNKEDVEEWRKKEPMIRFRLFLEKKGLWTKEYEEDVLRKALEAVDREIEAAEKYPAPDPADIIRYTNSELTQTQKRELEELGWEK
ncbi:MAG: pyruvate dehydrogenase (acetyl-transferring) E1 component subunit alpha [Deltaproteobacteria bacterium]|nr:pyruvate dehydrogenase (acetyl-transferring) E1 component subunit alpha [Deltaproteobacteria bacterium]